MWIENENKPDIYPEGKTTVADARKEWTRIAGEVSRNLTLRRLYAFDNYSFFVKKICCLFLSILSTLFQNYVLGEMNGFKKNFHKLWRMSNELMKEENRKVRSSPHITPKGKCTLPTNFRIQEGRMTLQSLVMNLTHDYGWQRTWLGPHLRLHVGFPGQKWLSSWCFWWTKATFLATLQGGAFVAKCML